MSKNYFYIKDTVQFSLMSKSLMKIQDDYNGAFKPTPEGELHRTGMGVTPIQGQQDSQQAPKGLLVTLAATHSGIITRNNGFYLPNKMRAGASSFIDDYPKPILVHHNNESDSIGRAYDAKYMDTSGFIQDKYDGVEVRAEDGRTIGSINQAMIKDFNAGDMPFGQSVDVVRKLFNIRDGILEDQNYPGLGYIQLVANITDPDAIQKLLDGRYLTGSVGASTDAAVCSVCKQDWTQAGKCEHKPGAVYDSTKCFIITGNLKYDEYSFVNKPADKYSKVMQLYYNDIQDSVDIENSFGKLYEVNLEFPQYDNTKEEENLMAKKNKDESTKNGDLSIQDNAKTPPVEDTATSEDTTVKDDVNSDDNSEHPIEDETTEGNTDETPEEISIEDLVIKVLEDEVVPTEEQEQQLYDLFWEEVVQAVNEGQLVLTADELKDAKLSTEKRKSLTKSQFCGPNRSFPVNDCAHVVAAKRLIGRAKLSDASKEKVMACVNRKEKAFGCKSKIKDTVVQDSTHTYLMHQILSVMETTEYNGDDNKVLTEEEMGSLRTMLKRLAGMVGKDAVQSAAIAEGLAHNEQDLLDEIITNEETIGDLRDKLESVEKEYHDLYNDVESLQDQVISSKQELRSFKEQHLNVLANLNDCKVENRDWTALEDSALDVQLKQYQEQVDIVKITDKIGNGMSQEPSEKVENPADIVDSETEKPNIVIDAAKIEEQYMHLLFSKGEVAAKKWLNNVRQMVKFPQSGNE